MARAVLFVLVVVAALFLLVFGRRMAYSVSREGRFYGAIERGDVRAVRAMLDNGMPVMASPDEEEGISPLEVAAMHGQTAVLGLLLDRGADINCYSGWATPLSAAVEWNHGEAARLLISRGATINEDRDGSYALWAAVRGNHPETVKLLLDHGANPNTRYENLTVLRFARQQSVPAVVALLEKAGAKE